LDETGVYRIRNDQTLEKVLITPGLSSWSFVEVVDGLADGDQIVNNPARKLLAVDTLVSDKADEADSDQ
ncbi:MAG: hypothetical protein DRQ52_08125, partial [Gammaproteobacteria bacterium]